MTAAEAFVLLPAKIMIDLYKSFIGIDKEKIADTGMGT